MFEHVTELKQELDKYRPLLMNFILMKNDYPPAVIKADDNKRIQYIQALEGASTKNDTQPFIQLIIKSVEESLERYLYVLDK